MDLSAIERIVYEEVMRALAESQRAENIQFPPNQNETLDPNACKGGTCSLPAAPAPELKANPIPAAEPDTTGPAVLVIFSGAREEWPKLTEAFKSWRKEGIALDAIFSSSASEVISPDEIQALGFRLIDRPAEIRKIMYDMSRYAALFLPSISRTHAAKLALGITDNVTLNLTISALAQKITTFATTEGLDPTACVVCGNNVPGIQEVLDKYRDQLAKMGMKLRSTIDAVKEIQQHVLNKADSESPELISYLITEEDAARFKGPVVKVTRGGLVTPLAMESFNKRGIEVVIVSSK